MTGGDPFDDLEFDHEITAVVERTPEADIDAAWLRHKALAAAVRFAHGHPYTPERVVEIAHLFDRFLNNRA